MYLSYLLKKFSLWRRPEPHHTKSPAGEARSRKGSSRVPGCRIRSSFSNARRRREATGEADELPERLRKPGVRVLSGERGRGGWQVKVSLFFVWFLLAHYTRICTYTYWYTHAHTHENIHTIIIQKTCTDTKEFRTYGLLSISSKYSRFSMRKTTLADNGININSTASGYHRGLHGCQRFGQIEKSFIKYTVSKQSLHTPLGDYQTANQ